VACDFGGSHIRMLLICLVKVGLDRARPSRLSSCAKPGGVEWVRFGHPTGPRECVLGHVRVPLDNLIDLFPKISGGWCIPLFLVGPLLLEFRFVPSHVDNVFLGRVIGWFWVWWGTTEVVPLL
jgi:hypothetical protein